MSDCILIMEDEPDLASLLGEFLTEAAGYEVKFAANAPAALQVLNGGGVDLALVDLLLPGGSGEEVAARAIAQGVPVLLMSGRLDGTEVAAALGAGFLAKPFRLEDLLSAVCAALASAAVPVPAIAA